MGKKRKGNTETAVVEDEVILTDDDIEAIEEVEPDVETPDDESTSAGGLDDMTKNDLKAKAKELGLKGYSRLGKEELVAAIQEAQGSTNGGEAAVDLDELSRKQLKELAVSLGITPKKKWDDDKLREKITAVQHADAPEPAEDKPAKEKGKGKGGSKKGQAPPTRELPAGKLGAADVAKLAGTDARTVRLFLRKKKVEKDEELGRYAFTKKQAEKLAKQVKADAASDDD
jgi:hypothetical protein